MSKVFVASDHRGFMARVALLNSDLTSDFELVDLGPATFNPADDYNDAAVSVASAVKANPGSFGVLFCGSAHGISIQANRFKGIRAVVGYSHELAKLAREHNDANIICFSADFQAPSEQQSILKTFLTTNFSGEERHSKRIERLDLEEI